MTDVNIKLKAYHDWAQVQHAGKYEKERSKILEKENTDSRKSDKRLLFHRDWLGKKYKLEKDGSRYYYTPTIDFIALQNRKTTGKAFYYKNGESYTQYFSLTKREFKKLYRKRWEQWNEIRNEYKVPDHGEK